QFTEQAERDHALARPGAALHDNDGSGLRRPRSLDRVQNQLVGDSLLIEQNELLAILNFRRREVEQRVGGPMLIAGELVPGIHVGVPARVRIEYRTQVVDDVGLVIGGEKAAILAGLVLGKTGDFYPVRIVQVGDSMNGTRPTRESRRVV